MDKNYNSVNRMQDHLQVAFLEKIKEMQLSTSIFLHSGIKLTGKILDFDNSIILLANTGKQHAQGVQLIYKHAISTISVAEPEIVQFFPVDNKNLGMRSQQEKLN